MRKYIIFWGFLCLCLELAAQTYPKEGNVIRILTYNTHYCKGGTDPGSINDANTRLLASVIKTLDADVVSLQELDSAANSRGKRYLLEQIGKATGLNYTPVYGSALKWDGGSVGCGSLIKTIYPISKIKKIALPGDEPRIAVRTDLDKFVFISVHGDLNDTKRIQGANIINNELDYIRKPVFLAGDLNDCHRWGNGGIAFPMYMEKFTIASDTKGNTVWNGPHGEEGADQGLIDYVLFHDYNNSRIEVVQTHIVRSIEINGAIGATDKMEIPDYISEVVMPVDPFVKVALLLPFSAKDYPVFVDIRLPGSTSIENVEGEPDFNVYFDGVGERFCIQGEMPLEQIDVYALTGQKMAGMKGENVTTVDVFGLSKGVYIVKGFSAGKSLVRKVIKE